MIKYALGLVLAMTMTLAWADSPKKDDPKKDDLVCTKNEELQKIMTEKGFEIILNMTNNDGVVQSLWVNGQSAVITAAVPKTESSCLLVTMKDVVYNPYAIESIWENYKKQTKQKDI